MGEKESRKRAETYPPKEDSFLLKKAIIEQNLKDKKCLDMGAGSGIQAEAMFEAGAEEVLSVDINPKVIAELKEKTPKFLDSPVSPRPNDASPSVKLAPRWRQIESDLFTNVNEKFDLIAFNPPYVPSDEIKWVDTDGGKMGREIIDKFLKDFEKYLKPKGILLLLISSLNNENEVISTLQKKGFAVEPIEKQSLFFEELIVLKAFCEQG